MRIRNGLISSVFLVAAAFGQATQPATTPATNPADAAAVKDALTQFNAAVAAGDTITIGKYIDASTDLQKKALAQMTKLTAAGHALYDETAKHFGADKLEADHVSKESFPAGFPQLPVDQLQVKTSGDAAVFTTDDGTPLPLTMNKKDGVWKFDGSMMQVTGEKDLAEREAIINAASEQIEQTRADVSAGHFRSPDEVVVLLQHRVNKVIEAEKMKQAAADAATAPAATPTGPVGPVAP